MPRMVLPDLTERELMSPNSDRLVVMLLGALRGCLKDDGGKLPLPLSLPLPFPFP